MAALRKSLAKKTTLGKEALRGFAQIRLSRLKNDAERNEKKCLEQRSRQPRETTQGASCSVVSPTVLNHHHHHHHHLTREEGERENENEAIRWRDKKRARARERIRCVFVLLLCAALSLLSRLSPIISRCCNRAEEAQHRGNEETELLFGNS